MATGYCEMRFNAEKGYGFIQPDDGVQGRHRSISVHWSVLACPDCAGRPVESNTT